MEESIKELIEFIKSIDPDVWEILLRQVYVQIFQGVFWAIATGSGSVASWKFAKKFYIKYKEEGTYSTWDLGVGIGYLLSAVFGLISLALLSSSISMLINPEFYAIKLVLESLIK